MFIMVKSKILICITGWPINIKPQRNSYTKGCIKMRASQQWNKLFIVNLPLFWGTVCVCRPTLKKDTDQNVLPVIFQYSCQIRHPAIFEPDEIGKTYIPQKKALNRSSFIYLYSGVSFKVHNSFLCHLAWKWQVV